MDYLDILQQINNFLYTILGFNEYILEIQVFINSKRNELNIPDANEVIYTDETGEYVQ